MKAFAVFRNTGNTHSLKHLSPIVKKQHAELMSAYKQESDSKTKERMPAVFNVIEEGETIPTIARLFHKSYNSIKNWVMRFKKFEIAGLYEEPRSGRPLKILNHKITEYLADIKNGIFPKQLVRQIKKDTGVSCTESGIREMLRRHNFTPKVPGFYTQKQGNQQRDRRVAKIPETVDFMRKTGRF